MLRGLWVHSTGRFSACYNINSFWERRKCLGSIANSKTPHYDFFFSLPEHLISLKIKAHIKHELLLKHSFTSSHLGFTGWTGRETQFLLPSFPLSNATPTLCLTSHNISCLLPPSLSSRIKWYCLYTPSIYHPISHLPRLVYPPWVLGRHKGTLSSSAPLSSSLSSPFAFLLFFPPTTAGCLWPLIYEGLLNPGGLVWSTLGEFGWLRESVVKTQVIYSTTCCLILLGLVKILLEAASANCSILLHALPSVPVCLVINARKRRVGGDKNKHCRVSQGVQLGDLCRNQWLQ